MFDAPSPARPRPAATIPRFAPFRFLAVLALLAPLASRAAGDGTATIKELSAAPDGDSTIFRVDLALPPTAEGAEIHYGWMTSISGEPPVLVSDPIHAIPCYPAYAYSSGNGSASSIKCLSRFLGRAATSHAASPINLTLSYLDKNGDHAHWATQPITLDLSKAVLLTNTPARPPNAKSRTDTATTAPAEGPRELTPAQQFAVAEADNFRATALAQGDPLGFYAFATIRTLQAAKLPIPSDLASSNSSSNPWQGDGSRPNRDSLYDFATGARAIQETLQADRLLRADATTETRSIPVSSLSGVDIEPLPFDVIRANRQPRFSDTARFIPADQWYLRFDTFAKLQALADLSQEWGAQVLQTPEVGNSTHGLKQRLERQLALPSTALARALGPIVVDEVTMTGTDPFLREGTDLTLIFRLKQPEAFRAAVDQHWKNALAQPGVQNVTLDKNPNHIEGIATPTREVSAYRAFSGSYAYYSNSRPALERVLILTDRAKAQPSEPTSGSLAGDPGFRCQRSIWPEDPAQEDAFLYLSDPFLRRLASPETRIKAKRRLEAAGALRLIHNANLLHGWNAGPGATPTLDGLKENGLIRPGDLEVPDAAPLAWNPTNATASSSRYNTLHFLTPLSELAITDVTPTEETAYNRFRDQYANYWRQYFDPIAVRIRLDGKTVIAEADIEPLIDGSAYASLREITGKKPATLNLATISSATLARWQIHLDRDQAFFRDGRRTLGTALGKGPSLLDWVGEWAAIWVEDGTDTSILRDIFDIRSHELAAVGTADEPDPEPAAKAPSSFSDIGRFAIGAAVESRSPVNLALFLVALQGAARTAAPGMVRFIPQTPYKDVTFVKIAPSKQLLSSVGDSSESDDPASDDASDAVASSTDNTTTEATTDGEAATPTPKPRRARASSSETSATGQRRDAAIYYAPLPTSLAIATQKSVLEHLVDASQSASQAKSRKIEYSAFLALAPANLKASTAGVRAALRQWARSAERNSLHEAWLLYRAGQLGSSAKDNATMLPPAADSTYGGEPRLPSGGAITFDKATGQAVSSAYGPMRALKAQPTGAPGTGHASTPIDAIAQLRAWLRFTEFGLVTRLEIERPN